jgi:hypothetical protein
MIEREVYMAIQLAAKNVIGRDQLIRQIWKMLRSNSVVFTAERRIGKTTVMQKMQEEVSEGVVATYLDLEKVETPQRFVEVLLEKINGLLPKTDKAVGAFQGLLQALGGTEIGGIIKIPVVEKKEWQAALEKTLACICEHHSDSMILFLFDELPYMLQKISVRETKEGSTSNSALAILDSLRAIRAEQKNLRMIYTGSIGLHHVIQVLRGSDYASQPLNEMPTVEIGPLDRADAVKLASRLLSEEVVECDNEEEVVRALVEQADCVPFYIEQVVKRLALADGIISPESVTKQVLTNLTDDNDHWEMEHFRTRIPIYYPGYVAVGDRMTVSKASVVSRILDILAGAERSMSIDQVYNAVKSVLPVDDRSLIIQLLRNLSQDHYLISDEQKNYSFRFPLIRKWWRLAQGIAS